MAEVPSWLPITSSRHKKMLPGGVGMGVRNVNTQTILESWKTLLIESLLSEPCSHTVHPDMS